TCLYWSKIALSPPTQIANRPVRAPCGPPLTGASSTCAPILANTSWMRRTSVGELVLRSKYTLPGRMPWSRPFSPSATASTSGGPGNDVNTMSLACATARGVSAQVAPASRCGAAASRLMSCTTSAWPPLSVLSAILEPIVPRPINPTCMSPPSSDHRGPCAGYHRGISTIDAKYQCPCRCRNGAHPCLNTLSPDQQY